MQNRFTPTTLTIAGSDPYGGAGVEIDAKVIQKLGGYAFSVTTALTAQNSTGVKGLFATPSNVVKMQLDTLLQDIKIDSFKIGMLANKEIISTISKAIEEYNLKNIILDTVLVSSSGTNLLEPSAIQHMVDELFPKVELITPNIPEVNMLLGSSYSGDRSEIEQMANGLFELGANSVLIKGGHSKDKDIATDYLVHKGCKPIEISTPRVDTTHTHGTGCILSSAIAVILGRGKSLDDSTRMAKYFLYKKLTMSKDIIFDYREEVNDRREPII